MATDQKALQKKRAKRELKRKQMKKAGGKLGGALSLAREWSMVGRAPLDVVLVPQTLFSEGVGTLWISRRLPDGRYALTGFLLDLYCLGVKNALFNLLTSKEYQDAIAQIQETSPETFERWHPSCARKLIEGARAYAKDLGFDPHPDFRIAGLILGDIDAAACPERFTFGRDGKPCYIAGPNDSPSMQRRVLKQLERRCGSGHYDFLCPLSGMEPDA